jgi:hypothetical protein
MKVKQVKRNIPPERENLGDRFRVNYGDKNLFDVLQVTICRNFTGQQVVYEFQANDLADNDSIHFSTSIEHNTMFIQWDSFIQDKAKLK